MVWWKIASIVLSIIFFIWLIIQFWNIILYIWGIILDCYDFTAPIIWTLLFPIRWMCEKLFGWIKYKAWRSNNRRRDLKERKINYKENLIYKEYKDLDNKYDYNFNESFKFGMSYEQYIYSKFGNNPDNDNQMLELVKLIKKYRSKKELKTNKPVVYKDDIYTKLDADYAKHNKECEELKMSYEEYICFLYLNESEDKKTENINKLLEFIDKYEIKK